MIKCRGIGEREGKGGGNKKGSMKGEIVQGSRFISANLVYSSSSRGAQSR
jgi:hypothetical protein